MADSLSGIGSQVKGHNIRRFSVGWSLLHVVCSSASCNLGLLAKRLSIVLQGDHYQFSLMTPNFTPERLNCDLPKVQITAVGPAMMNVAAEEVRWSHASCLLYKLLR